MKYKIKYIRYIGKQTGQVFSACDLYPQGTIELKNTDDKTVIKALKNEGYIKAGAHYGSFEIEGSDDCIYINTTTNEALPAFELRLIK